MMQTQAVAKQFELALWQVLKTAKSEPLTTTLPQLWQKLEQVIELTSKSQKLRVAGDAIASIVEIYVMRADAILSSLEAKDTDGEPILSEDFLNDLMRQSMSIDLSDMMEDLFPEPEPEPRSSVPARGSFVAPLDKETVRAIASQANIDAKQMLVELAGSEQVSQWAEAIANWMQQRSGGDWVSLLQLQEVLGKPLVDIWLGLLLSEQHQYEWERSADFYSNAGEIRLRQRLYLA